MSEVEEMVKRGGKRPALGRGLGSLLGESASSTARNPSPGPTAAQPAVPDHARIWQVDIGRLQGNPKQPRRHFSAEAQKDLAASIKEKGILQPIVARPLAEGRFEIIAGERRWRAAQLAGLREVPVILKSSPDQEALELALIENLQREDLNPIETAEAYSHILKTYGLTQQLLADRLGQDRATVANTLRLLGLAPKARELLLKGEIATGHAKVLLMISDLQEQGLWAERTAAKKFSVRELERQIGRLRPRSTPQAPEESGAAQKAIAGLTEELQKLIGTRVVIEYLKGRGSLSLAFHSDEELNGMVEKMRSAWRK